MSIFKAYDIRGKVGKNGEIDEKLAFKIGVAFVRMLKCKRVVVGYDMRDSSPWIFDALALGMMSEGADVIDIGLCSTPMFYFAIANYKYDAGLMITASHNPAEYNGFKMCREKAIPVYGEQIQELKRIVDSIDAEDFTEIKGKIEQIHIKSDYVAHVIKFAKKIKPLRLVIDAGNGMAGFTAQNIFSHLPCDVTELFYELDGSFPNHEANPLKYETLKTLQGTVLEKEADLGISFDGDADRVAFVDENGKIVPSDVITALIAKHVLMKEKGAKILYDLRSSKMVKEVIEENNGVAIMCRVGHSFIKQQMRDEDAFFAGELSGHYYFKENFVTDSGMVALMYVLSIVSEENKKFSELIKPLMRYYQSGEINSDVKDVDMVIKKLEEKYKDAKILHLDGVTISYDDWWFNVRPSNTEPVLRLNLEAESLKMMKEKRDEVLKLIRE